MFRNLIFDWSGTLVDDLGPVIEATNAVLEKYSIAPLDREQFRRRFRLPYSEFYAELLPHIALDELEQHFRPAFAAATSAITILPHAREKLEWCSALGIRCFVLTSMDQLAFEGQLDDFQLRHHFEATYSGVLDKRELIHQILENHGLDPTETAFVGDMTHDVETARHGGISSIAVLTGYNHAEVIATARPDLTVPDLGILRSLLDRQRFTTRPISTVGALIHDGAGKLLLIRTHKWGGRWGIPGGKIERCETALAALHREVCEETALVLKNIQFVMVQESINSPEFMRPEHFILINYVAEALTTDVLLNDEAEEFLWLTSTDALALNLNHATRILITECMARDFIPCSAATHPLDAIEIRRLRVSAHIGVPDEERAKPQTLLVTVLMKPSRTFSKLADDISRTVDYHTVSLEIDALAAASPRNLIETLATDIAEFLLENHHLTQVSVRIEKHILPNTECVAVEVRRNRGGFSSCNSNL